LNYQNNNTRSGGKAMRNKNKQMSLLDIYKDVEKRLESDKPAIFQLLDEQIKWYEIIPDSFYLAFYKQFGRGRKYQLESFMRVLFLQRIFHYVEDTQLLNTLRFSREMREYCEFDNVPDASKLTRFKQEFCENIREVFENLVEITEPICRRMDSELSDVLTYDTTGIESYVTENNPKFPRTKPTEPTEYTGAAYSNPQVKLQYINGHMCYAQKTVVVANGLGIVRHLELLDDNFTKSHPEMQIEKRTNCPEHDKVIGDSTSLKPVLNDFRNTHPNFKYSTFSADSAFDSYDNYTFLMSDCKFKKAVIPINPRGGLPIPNVGFNEYGTPLCPKDKKPFAFHSNCGGNGRTERLKFVCPGSRRHGTTMVNHCESPCTVSLFGRCVYVYPNKNLRLYPGLARESDEFAKIYKQRTTVERSINSLKDTLGVDNRKTSNTLTTKADLFLAGIVQLICVLLAHKLHDAKLARSPRRLIA
jgi:hypothetical protein